MSPGNDRPATGRRRFVRQQDHSGYGDVLSVCGAGVIENAHGGDLIEQPVVVGRLGADNCAGFTGRQGIGGDVEIREWKRGRRMSKLSGRRVSGGLRQRGRAGKQREGAQQRSDEQEDGKRNEMKKEGI